MPENNENKFNKVKYDNNFQKENYDRIVIKVKKGKKKELETHVADFGYKNVSAFIKSAINEKIARDLEKM